MHTLKFEHVFARLTMDHRVGTRWLPVIGYERHYEVSDSGSVRSVKRGIRPLRAFNVGRKGEQYLAVTLYLNGLRRNVKVHLLVLRAFRGPCPVGYEASHADGNSANNRESNLLWETKSQNCKRRKVPVGEKARNRKLTLAKVRSIRIMLNSTPKRRIAKKFGVSTQTISDIADGRSWRAA